MNRSLFTGASALLVSLLAFGAGPVQVAEAVGPKVINSKTWYENSNYASNKWVFRHFTFTFDQPLFLKDRTGTVASIADPIWYYKQQSDVTVPRLQCKLQPGVGFLLENGGAESRGYEPETVTDAMFGTTFDGYHPDLFRITQNRYQGCAPYFFRAFDGNMILTEIRQFAGDKIAIGPNFQFTYRSKLEFNKNTRLPDYDGSAIYPGIKENGVGYNQTQLYFDMINYRTDIPLDLIDDRTLTITNILYLENGAEYDDLFPFGAQYASSLVISGRQFYGKYVMPDGINTPTLNLLCNTLETDDMPVQEKLSTWDETFSYILTSAERAKVMNAAGEEAISGSSANLNSVYSACTVKSLTDLNDKYAQIQADMLKSTSPKALTTLQVSLKTLASQFPYDACFGYIKTLYNTTTTEVSISGSTDCLAPFGTLDYAVDPCCNLALAFKQCCAPKTVKAKVTRATALTDAATCANPTYALSAVASLVNDLNIDNTPVTELASQSFSRLTAFQGECYEVLFNTTCASDVICQYGSTCDTTQQLCVPPFEKLAESTLACYSDRMDVDLKNRLIAELRVQLDSTGKPVAADFVSKFEAAVVRPDCVGPSAAEYRTRYSLDSFGRVQYDRQGAPVLISGSESSCLLDQQCAYTTAPGESCAASKLSGSNFCGLCNDKTCVDITRPAQCVVSLYTTPNTCQAAGLFWKPLAKQSVYSRYFPTQTGICVDLSATTEEQCLIGNICPLSSQSGDSLTRCAQPLCYTTKATDSKSCQNIKGDYEWQQSFNSGRGLCVDAFDAEVNDSDDDFLTTLLLGTNAWKSYVKAFLSKKQDNSGCDKGMTQFTGRVFIPAKFNTPAACAAGQCSIRNDNLQYTYETETLDAAKCGSLQQCSTTCPRCRSASAVDSSASSELVCYQSKAAVSSARQCFKQGGSYIRLSKTQYICRYSLDKPTCQARGYTVADCTGMSKDTCRSGPSAIDQLLQCRWSSTSSCPLNTCSTKGQCNDAEFVNNKAAVSLNGAKQTGACLIPAPIVSGSPRVCSLIRSTYNNTASVFQVNSKLAGVCLDFSVDRAKCAALGHQFQDVATNSAECAAHGSHCFEVDGSFSAKSAEQCSQCGGKSVPAYRWTAAKVESGVIRRNTAWKPRQTVSINSWSPTVVFPLLDQLIQKVTLRKIAVQQISAVSLQMSSVLSTINTLACDCSTPYKADTEIDYAEPEPEKLLPGDLSCFTQTPIVQSIGDLVPGSAIQLYTTHAVVFVDLSRSSGFGEVKTLQLGLVAASTLSNDLAKFEVKDQSGVVVGYLIGSGLNLNDSTPVGTTTVTLSVDRFIGTDIPAEFSAAGVAQLMDGQLRLIDTASVFVNSGSAIQTTSVHTAGTFFPVKVTPATQQAAQTRYAARVAKSNTSDANSAMSVSLLLISVLALIQLLM